MSEDTELNINDVRSSILNHGPKLTRDEIINLMENPNVMVMVRELVQCQARIACVMAEFDDAIGFYDAGTSLLDSVCKMIMNEQLDLPENVDDVEHFVTAENMVKILANVEISTAEEDLIATEAQQREYEAAERLNLKILGKVYDDTIAAIQAKPAEEEVE